MGLWGKLALWSATPRTGTPRNTPPLPLTTSQVRREREARGDVRRERLINCNDMLSGIFLTPPKLSQLSLLVLDWYQIDEICQILGFLVSPGIGYTIHT